MENCRSDIAEIVLKDSLKVYYPYLTNEWEFQAFRILSCETI